jgi:uncharacterized protein involved in oxidation of intracellular sulfur
MKLDIILSQAKSGTVFNALRLANRRLKQGHRAKILLLGKGVELNTISDPKFDLHGEAAAVLDAGGEFLACGTCLSCGNRGGRSCVCFRRSKTSAKSRHSSRLVTF